MALKVKAGSRKSQRPVAWAEARYSKKIPRKSKGFRGIALYLIIL